MYEVQSVENVDKIKIHPIIPLLPKDDTSIRIVTPADDVAIPNKKGGFINHQILDSTKKYYDFNNMPFLQRQFNRMQIEKPYKGLRILHNTHMTWSTVAKIQPLLVSGADVTVTVTKTLKRNPSLIKLLKRAGVKFVEPEKLTGSFDICLDCCAELCPDTIPSLGVVEQTQTGSVKYQQMRDQNFGIISIDDSRTKKLETLYGTGNGFIRALKQLTNLSLEKLRYCVIGYGKVGHGIVNSLQKFTDNICILEKDHQQVLELSDETNLAMLSMDDTELTQEAIRRSDVIVTATGVKDLVSQYFEREDLAGKVLANMGSEDEFGYKFKASDVLANKMPINFTLLEPTLAKYLDPIFYLHNAAIDVLLENQGRGIIEVPADLDQKILNDWRRYHDEDYELIDNL